MVRVPIVGMTIDRLTAPAFAGGLHLEPTTCGLKLFGASCRSSAWMERKGYARLEEVKGILRLLEPDDRDQIPQWLPVADETRCSDCDICVRACVDEAISLENGTARIDEELCEGCRTCYYVCPKGAITLTAGA